MENPQWQVPQDLYYDREDYWVEITGNEAKIGITAFGQNNTGDVLYLELPPEGTVLTRGDKTGSIESGKWVGKLSVPLSGKVLQYNNEVETKPYIVNQDAYGTGWLYRIKLSNLDEINELMNADTYRCWIEGQIKQEQENAAI
ncbi:MAG TPA: glycine cleavage system protein GcvH [Syntrophomonadaceae bacterium]|nr:glycine cleavage system protein GcvH [Syntrophomonadaceae bacterium]